MSMVTIELDEQLMNLFHPVHGRPEDMLKEYLILELYRRHEISSGKAAELLEMERFEFVRFASRLGIPYFDMDESEWAAELQTLRSLDE